MFTRDELATVLAVLEMDGAGVAFLERAGVKLSPERYAAVAGLRVKVMQELDKLVAAEKAPPAEPAA